MAGLFRDIGKIVTKPPSEYRKEISPNIINVGQLAAMPASLMAASSLSIGAPELAVGMLPYELQAEAFLNQGENVARAAQAQEAMYDARRGIDRASGAGHNLYYSPDVERPLSEAVGGINRFVNTVRPLRKEAEFHLPRRGPSPQSNRPNKQSQNKAGAADKAGALQAIRNAMQKQGLL